MGFLGNWYMADVFKCLGVPRNSKWVSLLPIVGVIMTKNGLFRISSSDGGFDE